MTALAFSKHRHLMVVCVLAAYAALLTIYAIVAKSSQDIHPDFGEFVAWSSHLEWGTPKHPPVLPVIVRIWFSVFPLSDWACYLLAAVNIAAGLYCIWLLSGLWLRGFKRAVVPFLLMLIPFFNVLGLNFNHNTLQIPLWAITTYAFVRQELPGAQHLVGGCHRRSGRRWYADEVLGDHAALRARGRGARRQ
jgi:hypothetical protein